MKQIFNKVGFILFLLVSSSEVLLAQAKDNPTPVANYKCMGAFDFLHKVALNPNATVNKNNTPQATNKKVVTTINNSNQQLQDRNITKTTESKKEETSITEGMLGWLKDKYSTMIDVMPNQISNVMLYRFIDDWYGVKYRMGGTTKKGVDCSAFVQHLYQYVFGYDLLRTACLQFQSAKKISNAADLREGDLVFFSIGTSRISHVGVYLKNNFFVHSASSKGVSIANLCNAYWSKYFRGGGRIIQ